MCGGQIWFSRRTWESELKWKSPDLKYLGHIGVFVFVFVFNTVQSKENTPASQTLPGGCRLATADRIQLPHVTGQDATEKSDKRVDLGGEWKC